MTIRRPQIADALRTLLAGLDPFPPAAGFSVDALEVGEWLDLTPSLRHAANLSWGDFESTRDAGPVAQWEGVRAFVVSYLVDGANRADRTTRRDRAVPAVEAALAADRTLGLGDPQVWAELGQTNEEDQAPVPDATAAAVATLTINVTYVAASAAG